VRIDGALVCLHEPITLLVMVIVLRRGGKWALCRGGSGKDEVVIRTGQYFAA